MNDLRVAIRQAVSRPLFSALIVAVLGLGIGATTAIFSLADIVLFRELPVVELFAVGSYDPLTFAAVPLALVAFTLLAAWAPARRASRVDPMEMLRDE